ncbi:MAG: HD domain-containing phosphohydrolase [Syntrophobacteraceae bacterium]
MMEASCSRDRFIGMLSHFCAAVSNARLYGANHPLVSEYVKKTHDLLGDLFKAKDFLTVFLVGDDIILKDHQVQSLGPLGEKFTRILKEKGIERVTFSRDLSFAGLLVLVESLASADAVSVQSQPGIQLGKVEVRVAGNEEQPQEAVETIEAFHALRDSELDRIKQLYWVMKRSTQVDPRCLDNIVKGFIRGFRKNINPIAMLASVKYADEYTFTHVVNVGILTIAQAQRLGFSGNPLQQIGVASMLHDVGKTFIPDEILNKPGALTKEERAVIETHTVKGGRWLLGFQGIPRIAVFAAMEHHLKYDGSGYPFIKPGWRPNILSQMIAIADVFDAMRSRRVYSQPKPLDVIEEILVKEKGTTFNPVLVDNFLRLITPDNSEPVG